jgi:chemotaxis protein MotA
MGPGFTKSDYVDLLSLLYLVFKQVQQSGVMSLEAHFEDPAKSPILSRYPRFLSRHDAVDFLADSAKVIIVGGIAAHDLEALMDEDLKVHHDEAMRPSVVLTKIGDALPGLGIVAAVLGVVITMGHIDGPVEEIGHHVGAALIGTFLGILLSYGVVQPIAQSLEQRVGDDQYYCLCIKAGLLAVYKGNPPAIAVEFARRVLPHTVRPSFNETEQFCRAATKAPEKTAEAA